MPRPVALTGHDPAPIRKLHSLRPSDIETACLCCSDLSGWSFDQNVDYDGEVMLLIAPPESDMDVPAFVLTRRVNEVRLAVTRKERFTELGYFHTVADAMGRLREVLNAVGHGRDRHAA